jgi:Uma2 family endonuclease
MDSGPGGSRATVDDLSLVEGQAELIAGRIVRRPPHGYATARVVMKIIRALFDHEGRVGQGETYTSTLVYVVPALASGRESFSPDASYYVGPFPADPMSFIEGPPTFAVEVRSQHDYGPAAEAEMAARRVDYFEAGTQVVWDVDPVAERIHAYRPGDPARPATFARGQVADAEPAVPGWRIGVDEVFG